MLLTILAFALALGLLIAIHEYGHYRVAVACGVKVLRFSIGMGKPLLRWRKKGADTEFVIAALPLGGYVRMLDEREGAVAPEERHLAFNNQPLRSRAAIVAAGPLANLLLAVALYSVVNWLGVQAPKAVVSSPVAGSMAERAGLQAQDWVQAVQTDGERQPLRSWEDLRWELTQGALQGRDLRTVGRVLSADNVLVLEGIPPGRYTLLQRSGRKDVTWPLVLERGVQTFDVRKGGTL